VLILENCLFFFAFCQYHTIFFFFFSLYFILAYFFCMFSLQVKIIWFLCNIQKYLMLIWYYENIETYFANTKNIFYIYIYITKLTNDYRVFFLLFKKQMTIMNTGIHLYLFLCIFVTFYTTKIYMYTVIVHNHNCNLIIVCVWCPQFLIDDRRREREKKICNSNTKNMMVLMNNSNYRFILYLYYTIYEK
jgi:hypothetical protein